MNRPKKKIAVVVPKYGLIGGGERFAFEMTESLAAKTDYEFHVFANQWKAASQRIIFHKVPCISFPKWLQPISFAFFAQQAIKRIGIDLIHSHERILAADLWTVHSVPHGYWIGEIRGKKWPSLFDRATCWLEKKMFLSERCRLFMPVSRLAQEKVQSFFDIPAEKFSVIHPGVDLSKFSCLQRDDRVKARNSFGLDGSDFIILFVGMNFELKGLSQLLQAVALISTEPIAERIKILVVGKGDTEKFKRQADKLGIGPQVVIFAGVRDDMENIYGAADVLVLLSGFDTFGMVVLEAMAAALPVITSDMVGAKDLVEEGKNGFVVRRDDVARTAEVLASLARDPETLKRMKETARVKMTAHSWEAVTDKMLAIYEKVLGAEIRSSNKK